MSGFRHSPVGRLAGALSLGARRRIAERAFAARRRAAGRPRILVIDEQVPDPLFGAGYPRARAMIEAMIALDCDVSFYSTDSPRRDVTRMRRAFRDKVFFFPSSGAGGLARVLERFGRSFNMVLVSRLRPMRMYADGGWRPTADAPPLIVYDAEAVLWPREQRRRSLFGVPPDLRSSEQALADELRPVQAADVAAAVGAGDAAIMAAAFAKPVVIVSHAVDIRPASPPFAARRDFLFIGRLAGEREHSPNIDSVLWFASEVMPALDQLLGGDYRLHLVGIQRNDAIEALPSGRVVSHGSVDDVAALYDWCRVFVAPTRFAAGIPLKVVEAMGQGIPCVATPLLGDQLGVGNDILPTGSSAQAFARQCARLYQDDAAWAAVREAALEHVAQCYSRAALKQSLEELLARAGAALPCANR